MQEKWPIIGKLTHREKPSPETESNFYMGTKDYFVDFPNEYISNLIDVIFNKQYEYPDNPEKQLKVAKESAKKATQEFYERYEDISEKWLRIVVADTLDQYGYFTVYLRPDWDEFLNFIENLSTDDTRSLEEKYEYISSSRRIGLELESRAPMPEKKETVQDSVERKAGDTIVETCRILGELTDELYQYQQKLNKLFRQRKTIFVKPYVLLFLVEAKTILSHIRSLIEDGFVSPCFMGFRKFLENLCWAIFDDFLVTNSNFYSYFKENKEVTALPRPYRYLTREWYDKAKRRPSSWDKFKEETLKPLRDKFYIHLQGSGHKADKGKITINLRQNMSYPLFVALTGEYVIDKDINMEEFGYTAPFRSEEMYSLLKSALGFVMENLKESNLVDRDKEFIDFLVDDITVNKDYKYILPSFPKISFVIDYIDRLFPKFSSEKGKGLSTLFNEYSQFVHSYSHFWQVYPYSSVLEYKVLRHESNRFYKNVRSLLKEYMKFVENEWCYT